MLRIAYALGLSGNAFKNGILTVALPQEAVDRLMATRDANEGLVAFLAKRKPHWEHH